uniref:Uncharacterized protein n=1 Tax=Oryza sativa subsp. japonica TaxID=39947 RepID=Q8GVT0_ORYSJ|nr:hypothetical protein [Oryza sativa Japonica Group]
MGRFHKSCWPTIKNEVMAALRELYLANGRGFHLLNDALIFPPSKNGEAMDVRDFWQINLVQSFSKLFSNQWWEGD